MSASSRRPLRLADTAVLQLQSEQQFVFLTSLSDVQLSGSETGVRVRSDVRQVQLPPELRHFAVLVFVTFFVLTIFREFQFFQ